MKFSVRITEVVVAVVVGKYVRVVLGGESNNTSTIINYDASNITVDAEVLEGEKVSIEISSNNKDGYCDESKCVSTGLSQSLFNYSFTCYTDGSDMYPMMCSDGYKPQIVENETAIDIYSYQLGIADESFYLYYGPYQYFTCCPPDLPSDVDVSRHCSNSTSINSLEDPNNKTIVCDETSRPYHRLMKTNKDPWYGDEFLLESYVCCDSIINGNNNENNHTTNYLDEIECVPYKNKSYKRASVRNYYGQIQPAFCDEPESGFQFPRYIKHNNTDERYYECCNTKEGSTLFAEDSPFKMTIYPQIVISSIAVISIMVLIIALLIPLFRNLKTQSKNSAGAGARASASATTIRSTRTRTRPQRTTAETAYSSYNLYLVYLAIPDLILNLYLLIMYGKYANQKFNPNFYGDIFDINAVEDRLLANNFEGAFIVACSTANLYLNCVVLHEILMLLRKSHQVIRYDPPSLLKVTLQAVAVYLFSIIVFIIHYFIGRAASQASDEYEENSFYTVRFILNLANFTWSLLVAYVFPIVFFVYVWITIQCHGYMPSVTGRMKQLVWYFFRIVFVFCLIWLPGMLFVVVGAGWQVGFSLQIGLLFCGIQPIVSTFMAMTKSDVKKYTVQFITLSYIRTSSSEETQADNGNI